MSEPPPGPDPVDPLRMRASDADRERVAGVLREAYADGRLSPVEHEERLAEVYRATTYGELVPVLHDLPVPPGTLAVPAGGSSEVVGVAGVVSRAPAGSPVVVTDLADQGEKHTVAIFGGFERKGRWVVAPKLNATCIFGGGSLDLSEAVLTSQETEIQVACIFGGLEIIVPEGIAVQVSAAAVFGGNSAPPEGQPPAGAPLVRVTGAAVFGGVGVNRPKRGKKRALPG
ncbi:MAG TPA: DUF1707 domain-containing protein [Candidatus Nanopelagicales bacterium]|jgi:hypothetical protein|nr:DUF1707 domain-containing protein [Candidatus Nanopelagicales bacterium]